MYEEVKSALTNKQEANRQRALERLLQKNGTSSNVSSTQTSTSRPNYNANKSQPESLQQPSHRVIPELPKVQLTPDQKKRIEENRQKALEIQRNKNNRDATQTTFESDKRQKTDAIQKQRNSINRKDYIEYDFSTMKDSRGGFINIEETPDDTTLEEWKKKQEELQAVKDLPPPVDISQAPKCFECGSIEIDPNLYQNFWQVRVCRKCMKEKPDKYSLLTKTECREDYLLTDPELKDTALLPRIEKPNPHGYSRMQLYLRFQVEEYAWKKWGSAEGLDKEWERREETRLQRREKKYQNKMKEMRKKTRAEEYTRKLRDGKRLGERHVHDWSAPVAVAGELNTVKKRCIDCGVETEEIII